MQHILPPNCWHEAAVYLLFVEKQFSSGLANKMPNCHLGSPEKWRKKMSIVLSLLIYREWHRICRRIWNCQNHLHIGNRPRALLLSGVKVQRLPHTQVQGQEWLESSVENISRLTEASSRPDNKGNRRDSFQTLMMAERVESMREREQQQQQLPSRHTVFVW